MRTSSGLWGLRPPWGQSLLRSFLAAHSFPPPPPLDGASPAGDVPPSCRGVPPSVETAPTLRRDTFIGVIPFECPARADGGKHVAGGRRGKERGARNERSSDWRRGALRPRPGIRTKPSLLLVEGLTAGRARRNGGQ